MDFTLAASHSSMLQFQHTRPNAQAVSYQKCLAIVHLFCLASMLIEPQWQVYSPWGQIIQDAVGGGLTI